MNADFTDLRTLLDRYAEGSDEVGLRRIAEAARAAQERLTASFTETVTASDAAGVVQATVGLGSNLESVYIPPQAHRQMGAAGLGRACLEAITAARVAAAEALTVRLEKLSGPSSPDDVATALRLLEKLR